MKSHLVIPKRVRDPEKKREYERLFARRPDQQARRKAYAQSEKGKRIQAIASREWLKRNPDFYLWQTARVRARNRGIVFTITREDVKIPALCPVLGIPLQMHLGESAQGGGHSDSPSLDRIDNTLGYIPGNIQVISHLANSMKSTATREQLERFAQWVLAR